MDELEGLSEKELATARLFLKKIVPEKVGILAPSSHFTKPARVLTP